MYLTILTLLTLILLGGMIGLFNLAHTIALITPLIAIPHFESESDDILLNSFIDVSMPYYSDTKPVHTNGVFENEGIVQKDNLNEPKAILIDDPFQISNHVFLENFPGINQNRGQKFDASRLRKREEIAYPIFTTPRHSKFPKKSSNTVSYTSGNGNLPLSIKSNINNLRSSWLREIRRKDLA